MSLDQRIIRLLGSIIGVQGDYALARLELSMTCEQSLRERGLSLPPTLPRLADASERTLREGWSEIETRLDAIGVFVKQVDADERSSTRSDPAFLWLRRTVQELEQYARALRWVLTVTERIIDEPE